MNRYLRAIYLLQQGNISTVSRDADVKAIVLSPLVKAFINRPDVRTRHYTTNKNMISEGILCSFLIDEPDA